MTRCSNCLDVETCEDCEVGLCFCCCADYSCSQNVNYEEKKVDEEEGEAEK